MVIFHSRFRLAEGVALPAFQHQLRIMSQSMQELKLVEETGPIHSRYRHPVMDTDNSAHEYFFTMTFRDRSQCEQAVEYMYKEAGPGISSHITLQKLVADPVFSCWEAPANEDQSPPVGMDSPGQSPTV